ncbi:glycosyltransferase [Arenibacter sp. S6351L]|uniref:glycosyltransferase n=1 Tax=Arenibacter sp. S6351L TaxID=2926407 RepID=UPI001FF104EB|nr:glycosyltransferase [Arenibacter sp. S6351L]MCK0136982.1 glycosyltransferase [Arenibacter sp. S6351L]
MKKIILIYPGFPHYRNGIIETLLESKNNKYYFVGDKNGYAGIKPYDFKTIEQFKHCPSYRIGPFFFNKGLIRFALKTKADGIIVHSSPYWISIIIASLIFRLKKTRVINWTHGLLDDKKNTYNKLYYYFFKLFFDGLLLYSNQSKNNLVKLGYKETRANVIYNSLDYKNQIKLRNTLSDHGRNEIRGEMFINPENHQLIFIGRLTSQKRLAFLVNVVKLLKDENININLLFVGEGMEKESLIDLSLKLDIADQVHFYGASYDENNNYRLIVSSDICVAPGEIGLTSIHSLVYGVPVISHSDPNNQMPEFEAIKPGINGALFENGNIEDLKEKIKLVINLIENKSATDLKKDCYKIVDEYYNPDYQLKIIEKAFN